MQGVSFQMPPGGQNSRAVDTGDPVVIYEPMTIRFRRRAGPTSPAQVTFDVRRDADVSLLIAGPTGAVLGEVPAGETIPVPPGSYEVSLLERGDTIGQRTLALGPGIHSHPRVDWFRTASPVVRAVQTYATHPDFSFAVDLDKVMPQPGSGAAALVDPDPALILSILGAAAVCDVAPYTDLIADLPTFGSFRPGTSALFVLATPALDGEISVGGSKVSLDPVTHLDDIATAVLPVPAGSHLVSIRHRSLGEVLLSTIAFANRATMIVLARGGTQFAIRQYALPIGHLANELYPQWTDPDGAARSASRRPLRQPRPSQLSSPQSSAT